MGSYWMCYVRPLITSLEAWEHLCFIKYWKKHCLICGSFNFASVYELSWVIGVPGYYAWMDKTLFSFFPVLYLPPPQDCKLELILCWGQQAYWLPGILTYSYHRCFLWHTYTLCNFFLCCFFVCFCFVLQCCTGLWKGKCFIMCCCHWNMLCQCTQRKQFSQLVR